MWQGGSGLLKSQKNRGESAPTIRLRLTPKRAVCISDTARGVPHSPRYKSPGGALGAPILSEYDSESRGFNEFAAVDSVNPLDSLSYWINNHRLELKIGTPGGGL